MESSGILKKASKEHAGYVCLGSHSAMDNVLLTMESDESPRARHLATLTLILIKNGHTSPGPSAIKSPGGVICST